MPITVAICISIDAFARLFTAYTKEKMGEGMAAAKLRSGGRLCIEPDGEAFVRSICKLTHVGPNQYAKGIFLCTHPLYLICTQPLQSPRSYVLINPYPCVGDGIQFRDFCDEHYQHLVKQKCVGRAELSKRYMLSMSCLFYVLS